MNSENHVVNVSGEDPKRNGEQAGETPPKPAKILIITTVSGFLQKFEYNNVKLLKELGFEIYFASNFENPVYDCDRAQLEQDSIQTIDIPIQKSPRMIKENMVAFRILSDIVKKYDITHIHCHTPMGGVLGRLLKKKYKKLYVIYTAHGFHFYEGAPFINRTLYKAVERYLYRYTDQLIVINREDYKAAQKFRWYSFSPTMGGWVDRINGVGVDPMRFRPMPEIRDEIRNELNIPADAFHLITAAEFSGNKNQKAVIQTMASIKDKEIYYSLCGNGFYEGELKRLVHDLDLEDRIRFPGYRSDMERILQSADAFIFPSIREGLGIAPIEAMMCSVPVIVFDNRGSREYATNGVNAIVCNMKDRDSLKRAILELDENAAYRRKLADNCRDSVMHFTIDEVEKTMRKLYERAR